VPLPAAGRVPADAAIHGANYLPAKTPKFFPYDLNEIH
jgi:hypothetical protein